MNSLRSFWEALTEAWSASRVGSPRLISKLTPRAEQALALARTEAGRLHHKFVGTEHLLLGLLGLGQGIGVTTLLSLGLDLEIVRLEIERLVGAGPDEKWTSPIPYTPQIKEVLTVAAKEARTLDHYYIGTEHILLGLLQEREGIAPQVLKNLGVDPERTRQKILSQIGPLDLEGAQ